MLSTSQEDQQLPGLGITPGLQTPLVEKMTVGVPIRFPFKYLLPLVEKMTV